MLAVAASFSFSSCVMINVWRTIRGIESCSARASRFTAVESKLCVGSSNTNHDKFGARTIDNATRKDSDAQVFSPPDTLSMSIHSLFKRLICTS